MKLSPPQTLSSIALLIGCEYDGDPDFSVTGINEIHKVVSGDIVFVDHPKYYEKALSSAATTILINQKIPRPEKKALIFSENPCSDFNKLTRHFSPWRMTAGRRGGILLEGKDCIIHESVVVGADCSIGDRTIIHPGVVLYENVHIGSDCIIHANTVIGSDAFYYKSRPGGREKMHTCGRVEIGNNVEIGAGCTIDRGLTSDTRIGEGTKIDNHVHIGHDTVIGKNCLFAAQVGIAGCVVIEDDVILWGQVGVASDILIRKGAVVLAQSGLSKDLDAGKTYLGSPAGEARTKFREIAMIKKLPAIIEKLDI
ncbi:MAG: UDP-3-O-(3-hydroxymyristoyl)glucosamine N-acyltransferase [Crocinitomicaceae bacterium]|nr:UDP-3-O-(3-hydroxymyristoyl)glucosamine N-acyltransferase [Crocinitomicaceae bacterium]